MIRRPPRSTLFPYTTLSDLQSLTLRIRPCDVQIHLKRGRSARGLGFMATQTIAFRDGHQGAGDLDVVRQRFNTHDSSGGLPRGNKLRTNNSPSESVHNCVRNSERIMGIRAAMDVVLEFVRTAKLRDSELPISDGAEYLEARATRQSAVEELELLREQLYREIQALRYEMVS